MKENYTKLGITSSQVVMVGDSAGRNLINSVLVKNDFKDIKLVIELYPVIDNNIGKL